MGWIELLRRWGENQQRRGGKLRLYAFRSWGNQNAFNLLWNYMMLFIKHFSFLFNFLENCMFNNFIMKIQTIRNHAYHSSNFENNHENCMFMINKMILIKNTLWNHAICGWEVIMCIMLISIVISWFWVYEIMFNLKLWLMSIYLKLWWFLIFMDYRFSW